MSVYKSLGLRKRRCLAVLMGNFLHLKKIRQTYCPITKYLRGGGGHQWLLTRWQGPAGCEQGWNVEMELATPAHGGYFREPASRVNKQLNQGTMMMDKLRLNDWPCGDWRLCLQHISKTQPRLPRDSWESGYATWNYVGLVPSVTSLHVSAYRAATQTLLTWELQ